jgi:signal transduction histidine kinase/CheY-like chemotaxis protein
VGQILSGAREVGDALREVARELGRALGADMVGAYFLDERRERLVPLAGYHVPADLRDHFERQPLVLERFPALDRAWRTGQAVGSGSPRTDPGFDPAWTRALPEHSVLVASTLARGEPIGALFLVWWQPGRAASPAEVRLLEAVARQVGLAMENAELARQTQARLRETETLLSISRALSSTLDLGALVRHFLRIVTATLGADTVGVWMIGADGDSLEPLAGYHVPKDVLARMASVRLSVTRDPFYAEAVRTRRPVFSADVPGDHRLPDVLKQAAPHRSHLFVPIVVSERMIGGFAAVWWAAPRAVSDGELALMEAVANQAGVAIENARLFAENQRQLGELAALYQLSRAVTGQLDRAALVEAIRAEIARVVAADDIVMVLRDEEEGDLAVALRVRGGVREAVPRPARYPARGAGLMSVVLETGRALRTEDYAGECARRGLAPVPPATRPFWLGVPLRAGDRILGVLVLRGTARPFTAADERLLTNIGDLAALALRSAHLFEERTRAYTELAAAQDQLVRTEKLRALGEMASGVAHDFNNLLAAILGRTQLIALHVEDPRLRQWLDVIERAALDGAQTVRRLQEFTRIRRDEPLVAIDLNDVVRDALEITQSRWRDEPRRRGVEIEVRTALAELPPVAGDAAELREALTNLILNAVDAMPQGGVLTVESGAADGEVAVVVRDTGVGMPEHVRGKIFDPFFTTKGPQGTGLGLSMTYGILSRHGARITVETEEGKGSAFHLRFPGTERRAPAPPADAAPAPAAGPLRCLVVDDDVAVGGVVGDMLEASGHQVTVSHDPAEAIRRVGAETFDVVFTDLAMPGVSGWQVARAVKAVAPSVPVFLMTGFGVELSDEERQAHGLELVLVKPLSIQAITDALGLAERRRAQRP